MTRDKQLRNVELDQVIEKRRLDQALNAKEFAVLAGVSYSAARAWFRLPGFPSFCGVVFWQDFERWRTTQAASPNSRQQDSENREGSVAIARNGAVNLPARAAQILAEAG